MARKRTLARIGFAVVRLVLAVLLLFLLAGLSRRAFDFGYQVVVQEAVSRPPGRDIPVTLRPGAGDWEAARLLEEKGLVRDAGIFYVQLLLSGERGRLRSGSCLLNTSQRPEELIKSMTGAVGNES